MCVCVRIYMVCDCCEVLFGLCYVCILYDHDVRHDVVLYRDNRIYITRFVCDDKRSYCIQDVHI